MALSSALDTEPSQLCREGVQVSSVEKGKARREKLTNLNTVARRDVVARGFEPTYLAPEPGHYRHQPPGFHTFKAGMTEYTKRGRRGGGAERRGESTSREIAINPLARTTAGPSPHQGAKSADRPLPAPFRTRLPGRYPRSLPPGRGSLPLHAPRVPPTCVFGFHSRVRVPARASRQARPHGCAHPSASPISTPQQPPRKPGS